jgi:hypothetical protein
MNIKMLSVTTAASALLFGSAVFSQASFADEGLSQEDYQALFQDDPEFHAPTEGATRSSSPSMSCYVDTPGVDVYTTGYCFDVGGARTTVAVFRVDNPPANRTIHWSNSRCTNNSANTICILPISNFSAIDVSATVLDHDTGTFKTVSATAEYEGGF